MVNSDRRCSQFLIEVAIFSLFLWSPVKGENAIKQATLETPSFLRKLHLLVNSPPVTLENIAMVFNWNLLERIQPYGPNYWIQKYDVQQDENVKLAEATGGVDYFRLRIKMDEVQCIDSDQVIAAFGTKYQREAVVVDYFSDRKIDDEAYLERSARIKKNSGLFGDEPIYTISNGEVNTKLSFSFFNSECLNEVFIR